MKINKKWLIMGTAITTMVAPIATVVSCSNSANAANGDKTKEEDNIIVKPDPVSPDTTILTRDNYKDLSTYDNVTNTLTVHQGVIEIGDVFIQGGSPGHAIVVVDMAVNKSTNEKIFLLAQSFMPAQEFQVLDNNNGNLGPWYSDSFSDILYTPEWTFNKSDLMRFSNN